MSAAADPIRQLPRNHEKPQQERAARGRFAHRHNRLHQVNWRQRYTPRAENAADALQLVLCERAHEIPMLAAMDNLASVEPLCAPA
jgi:hypothetical protein